MPKSTVPRFGNWILESLRMQVSAQGRIIGFIEYDSETGNWDAYEVPVYRRTEDGCQWDEICTTHCRSEKQFRTTTLAGNHLMKRWLASR